LRARFANRLYVTRKACGLGERRDGKTEWQADLVNPNQQPGFPAPALPVKGNRGMVAQVALVSNIESAAFGGRFERKER
jgi:hypothetical protein